MLIVFSITDSCLSNSKLYCKGKKYFVDDYYRVTKESDNCSEKLILIVAKVLNLIKILLCILSHLEVSGIFYSF